MAIAFGSASSKLGLAAVTRDVLTSQRILLFAAVTVLGVVNMHHLLFLDGITATTYRPRTTSTDCNANRNDATDATETTNQIILHNTKTVLKHPKENVCDEYQGILFIDRALPKAGAGTLFFQSLVDSLIYSDKYNLMPFLWLNDGSNKPCYDWKVHGLNGHTAMPFSHHLLKGEITRIPGEGDMECGWKGGRQLGPPIFDNPQNSTITLTGNGLWQSYFLPLTTDDIFQDSSCISKPFFAMEASHIKPDMHFCSDFAVRGWSFKWLPKALQPNQRSTKDWLWDNRQRASQVVQKYFRLQPWLQARVEYANPSPRFCLAAHIRLTDKGSGRVKQGLEAYAPYIQAYARATASHPVVDVRQSPIYLATDDATVLQTIQTSWDTKVSSRVIVQEGALRSDSTTPTFKLVEDDKHRSNTEALIEIYSMAKCSYFVHGFSGMAEAVVYLNPTLHSRSVNIDDYDGPPSEAEFEELVRRSLPQEK